MVPAARQYPGKRSHTHFSVSGPSFTSCLILSLCHLLFLHIILQALQHICYILLILFIGIYHIIDPVDSNIPCRFAAAIAISNAAAHIPSSSSVSRFFQIFFFLVDTVTPSPDILDIRFSPSSPASGGCYEYAPSPYYRN